MKQHPQPLDAIILTIHGRKVILDIDLAMLYGVSTKALNQAIKRNADRFPPDFVFRLTLDEKTEVVTHCDHLARLRFSPQLPMALTEHGAIMAATVLNSPRAVQMSVFVVRAFVRMRAVLSEHHELASQLAALEQALKERLDVRDATVVTMLQRVLDILEPPRKQIGFHVKERCATYNAPRVAARA